MNFGSADIKEKGDFWGIYIVAKQVGLIKVRYVKFGKGFSLVLHARRPLSLETQLTLFAPTCLMGAGCSQKTELYR